MDPSGRKIVSRPGKNEGRSGSASTCFEGCLDSNTYLPSSPSCSSSPSLCPPFPHSQPISCPKKREDTSRSRLSSSSKVGTGLQKASKESSGAESSDGIADGYEKAGFIPSPLKRRRGVQSLGVRPPRSPAKLPAESGEQNCLAETCSSSPERPWLEGRDPTPCNAKRFMRGQEEGVPGKEHLRSYLSSFAYRGRQSPIPLAKVQVQPCDGAAKRTTARFRQLSRIFSVASSIKNRKLRLTITIFFVVVILLFGTVLPPLFRDAYLHRVYVHPLAAWFSQKYKPFQFVGEVTAVVASLLSEFTGGLAPLLLQPCGDIPSFTNLRLRATSFFSHIGLPRSETWLPGWWSRSTEKERLTMPVMPSVEELQKEFAQYALGRVPAVDALRKHSEEFKKNILRVTDDVYVAVGFGLANCVIIDAPEGLILVDTMESTAAMEAVWRAWLELPEARKRRRINRLADTHRKHHGARRCSGVINGTRFARCKRDGIMCTRGATLPRNGKRSCATAYRKSGAREGPLNKRCSTLLCKHRKRVNASQSLGHLKLAPPVKAIIYTHFHTDHVFGAAAVVQPDTEVHAYWLTYVEMSKLFTLTAGITYRRSMRQFGVFVEKYDFLNAGIGPALRYNSREEIGTVLPTHIMYGERKVLNIAGIKLELLHAPGESKDQLVVWLPQKKLLIGADNVYKSMPNIYAIRGTETRDCNFWVASLDMMRSLQPEFLILGHTRPLAGREYIASTLLAYRDAIQFIHDQTLRHMNKGYYANDIAHMVKLPPHLSSHPFLQPFYGTVPWAVKAIFTHYMGWFSGNPEDLAVISTQEKAETFLSLAGSVQNLLSHALKNLREGQVQRALEFASAAHHIEPASAEARTLKTIALRAAAAKQQAATGRNWFLTAALESEGHAELRLSDAQKRQTLSTLTMQQVFELLPTRLVPERAADFECVLEFHFTDVEEHACVHFRRGIAYQKWPCDKTADVVVETSREVWIGILNKDRSPALAVVTGDLHITGSLLTLVRALHCVELEVN